MSSARRPHTPAAVPTAGDTDDELLARVRQRPDGYHWVDVGGRQEFGPFDTLEEALADMDEPTEEAIEQTEQTEAAEQGLDRERDIDRLDADEPEGGT